MMGWADDHKTVKFTFEFTVPKAVGAEQVGEAIFDLLCRQDDSAPFESCDGWDHA